MAVFSLAIWLRIRERMIARVIGHVLAIWCAVCLIRPLVLRKYWRSVCFCPYPTNSRRLRYARAGRVNTQRPRDAYEEKGQGPSALAVLSPCRTPVKLAHAPIAASISAKVFATLRPIWGASPSCRAICVREKMPRTVRVAGVASAGPDSITSAC